VISWNCIPDSLKNWLWSAFAKSKINIKKNVDEVNFIRSNCRKVSRYSHKIKYFLPEKNFA